MPIQNWETELIELCRELDHRTWGSHVRILGKFIRNLLESAKKEERERIVELLKDTLVDIEIARSTDIAYLDSAQKRLEVYLKKEL